MEPIGSVLIRGVTSFQWEVLKSYVFRTFRSGLNTGVVTFEGSEFTVIIFRPKRTDVGGSRLLHRAILGLAPVSKQGRKTVPTSREGHRREKVIILPASVLDEHAPKKILMPKKQTKKSSGTYFHRSTLYNPATLATNQSVLIGGVASFQGGTCTECAYLGLFKVA